MLGAWAAAVVEGVVGSSGGRGRAMRVAFLVYGVLYVVIEIVGYQLEQVSWPEITALDVATAVTNAFLTAAVLVAVLVAVDVLGHRWRRSRRIARLERARLDAAAEWIDGEWIDGEWIDGEWIDGEWIDGEWIDGEWIDAEEV